MSRNSVRKRGLCLMLGAGLLLLPICAHQSGGNALATQTMASEAEQPDILPSADEFTRDEKTVTLYFRMRDESLLAQETRTVFIPKDKQFERVLIETLIEGPGASSLDLTGLFISGVQVVDVTVDGTVLTVTLSRAFLGTPVDAPMDWQGDTQWNREVVLRRRLALASIVNTVTEETNCTSVQLLVQFNPDYPAGERITRDYLYEDTAPGQLLSPVFRNEDELLTHFNTATIILDSYMEKDFARLHRFVAERPTEAAFVQEMESMNRSLVAYWISSGMVSPDGQRAVLTSHLDYIGPDDTAFLEEYPIHLVRERGIWKITYSTLLRMLEAN